MSAHLTPESRKPKTEERKGKKEKGRKKRKEKGERVKGFKIKISLILKEIKHIGSLKEVEKSLVFFKGKVRIFLVMDE